jgi:glycosidase
MNQLTALAVAFWLVVAASHANGSSDKPKADPSDNVSDKALATSDLFHPLPPAPHERDIIYFAVTDRFCNGNSGNDHGGSNSSDPMISGFDPTRPQFYHGGDLAGVKNQLDYIKHLGATAIWLTPLQRNKTVQDYGGLEKSVSGYHGYWILDFTRIDPHLGTDADLEELIAEAGKRDIGVIMDVVCNHTADVIRPKDGSIDYKPKFSYPYKDATGKPFDDRDYIGKADFPPLDPEISFPHVPSFASESDRHSKYPEWLNDPTVYHNRGNVSGAGESAHYGDISGLDDLFTEQPRVVQGMVDIYQGWIRRFDLAGMRFDAFKHVNPEFWEAFLPAVRSTAEACGRKDFWLFAEVYDYDPAVLSELTRQTRIPAVLDFGFARACIAFITGQQPAEKFAEFFAQDSYYASPQSSAHNLLTFVSNHDIGRVGYFIRRNESTTSPAEELARAGLALGLLLTVRGTPVLYYGDEQGFAGKGDDYAARQDMFASQTEEYANERHIGGGVGSVSSFDPDHPLYKLIQSLSALRNEYAPLRNGIQRMRVANGSVFAFSRIDPVTQEELFVATNNDTAERKLSVSALAGKWKTVLSTSERPAELVGGKLKLPPISCVIFRREAGKEVSGQPIASIEFHVTRSSNLEGRWQLLVETSEERPLLVAFGVREPGETNYRWLGTTDTLPYAIYPLNSELPNSDTLEFEAEARDLQGHSVTKEATWTKPARKRVGAGT